MARSKIKLLAFSLFFSLLSSCAVGLSTMGSAVVSSSGHVGAEGAVELSNASRGSKSRFVASIAVGGGYLEDEQASHVLIMPGLGAESGTDRVLKGQLHYCGRIYANRGYPIRHSLGASVSYSFLITEFGSKSSSSVAGS